MTKITVLPTGQELIKEPGQKLSQALKESEIELNTVCGGQGTCGKCKVQVVTGELVGESLEDGSFLACKTSIGVNDVVLNIPSFADAAHRKSGLDDNGQLEVKSTIQKVFVQLDKPTRADPCPDWERLQRYLPLGKGYTARLRVLQQLPELLRSARYNVTVVLREQEVIGVEAGDTTGLAYGMAFDLGTTSVVAALIDLSSGQVVASESVANPQRVVGADVISRIDYATKEGSVFLQDKILAAMNQLIDKLIEGHRVERGHIYEATVVGNTTMQHLLLAIKPTYLARSPYCPVLKSALDIPAQELRLKLAEGAIVHVLPNIAGFVGSDTVGVILATRMMQHKDVRLAIDIGTNGEIALGNQERLLVCSTAAGPAFEGARISCGMRAAAGAIEGVELTEGGVSLKVIGNTSEVLGICGSGLIQAVAQMVQWGIVDNGGRMLSQEEAVALLPPGLASRVQVLNDEMMFVLTDRIYISQRDIREFQLAKGAITAGIRVLVNDLGIQLTDIKEVLLAGAFGSYIDRYSARAVGLVPEVPLERIRSIGNAAGTGARMTLLSLNARAEAQRIAVAAQNVELSSRADFQEVFMESINFRETYSQ